MIVIKSRPGLKVKVIGQRSRSPHWKTWLTFWWCDLCRLCRFILTWHFALCNVMAWRHDGHFMTLGQGYWQGGHFMVGHFNTLAFSLDMFWIFSSSNLVQSYLGSSIWVTAPVTSNDAIRSSMWFSISNTVLCSFSRMNCKSCFLFTYLSRFGVWVNKSPKMKCRVKKKQNRVR